MEEWKCRATDTVHLFFRAKQMVVCISQKIFVRVINWFRQAGGAGGMHNDYITIHLIDDVVG